MSRPVRTTIDPVRTTIASMDDAVSGKVPPSLGGVPPGGTTGQALVKSSDADYAATWSTGLSLDGSHLTVAKNFEDNVPLATFTSNAGSCEVDQYGRFVGPFYSKGGGDGAAIDGNVFRIDTAGEITWSRSSFLSDTPDVGLSRASAGVIQVTDGASGGGSIATGHSVTSARPVVTTVGSQWFDATLGLPIWWNGSAWVNAAGATA